MKININKKYVIILSLILLIIVGLVVLNTTGVLKKIGMNEQQITEAEAKEKLQQVLQNASTQKETDANYNSSEYLTSLLQEQNIIVIENIVAIDGYNFEIDRETLELVQSLGKSEVTVNSELIEVLGKNDRGKYCGKAQITITSNIPIDNMIFQNENGTYLKETTEELTYKKEMEVELNKEYIITVVTKDGKVNNIKRRIARTDTSDSLLNAIETTILETGYYTIAIEDEVYSIHAYVFDEDTIFSTNQTFGDENDVATETEYAKNMIVVKVNGDLTIDSGKTVTAYRTVYGGPKGMVIYATGNITNNGTINMTARGAKAEGQNVYLWKNETVQTDNNGTGGKYEYVPAIGGSADSTRYSLTSPSPTGYNYKPGSKGEAGNGRQTGGGGGGGIWASSLKSGQRATAYSGTGTYGTSYSGGTGGGAGEYAISSSGSGSAEHGYNGQANGGTGGISKMRGDGAGNPPGNYANSYTSSASSRYRRIINNIW